ncbi:GIY-YIG nuclease family protein [Candidatus Dojkabacteria bacterium]|nr:GIY-YIG nuclease family protein [Candidatus Dojkabacteria bacterium]
MYYVYILQSINFPQKTYVGYSQNIKQRLSRHNTGNVKSTYKYRPWRVKFYCAFEERLTAMRFERYLKTASGIAFRRKRLVKYDS